MSNIRNLLENSSLLSGVSNFAITALCRRAELVELSVGKPFQRSGQLAPGPALVLQGRLRRIYQQPGSPPLSLGSIEANDWVGWASVIRGEPDLTLIASQVTILALVPFSDAIEAVRADQSLQQALATPFYEETAVLLLQELERQGRSVAEPRQLIEELFLHWSLADPGADPSQGAIELFSGPRPASAMPIGAFLDQKSRIDLPLHVNQLPIRILSLPEAELAQALGDFYQADNNSNALALRPEQRPVLFERPGAEAAETFGFHRPKAEAAAFATGASSRIEQALACISHLAASKKLAYSAELVRSNLEDVERRLGALKLAQLGLQLEAMGFDTRPMRARPWDLTRLEPPALIDLDGAFVMLLVAAGGSGVLVGDPRVGLQRWSVKQLEERLPNGVELLIIREGRAGRMQEEAFGLGWFLPAFLRYPGLLSMTLITAFVSQLLSAVFPLGVLAVIDQVIGRNNISLLAPLTAVLVVAAIAAGITSAMRALVSADLSDRVDVRLGSTVVEHLMRLPLPYFEQRQVGGILFNVNQLYEIRKFIVDQLLGVGLDVIFAILFLAVLLAISPTLTLVVVGVAPILMLINIIASPVLIRLIKQSNGFASSASAYLYEVVSGIRTVKSQNFEVEARWQWLERYRKYTSSRFRLSQLASLIGETARLVSNLADVLLISLGAMLIIANKLTLGALFAVKILSSQVVGPLLRLSSLWQGIQEMRIALTCLSDVMLAIPEVGEEDLQALPIPTIKGLIRFEEVSFRYGQRGPLILDQVDLVVQPGQFVGLVGLSGSGKSTLVQMIDRLYRPKSGRISIDGYDIEKLQIAGLRRRIGYVPQDSLLFEGTVLDNIRLNSPDASIEAVMEAARTAAAHEFILNLDNGYATRLGEKGAGLSGGQKQRVCLARTVLQNPSLLILDEATSALDAETERIVCRNLATQFDGITVLFITHRLTTLRNADRILFMNNGRICVDGSHNELIEQKGSYATLYKQQVQEGDV